jgi:hypothetical protein
MGFWARRAYRKDVIATYRRILSIVEPRDADAMLKGAYGSPKRAINGLFDGNVPTDEAAVLLVAVVVGRLIDATTPENRAAALYAVQEGNFEGFFAYNLFKIIGNAKAECDHLATIESLVYEIVAALEGIPTTERSSYKLGKMLDRALTENGLPAQFS